MSREVIQEARDLIKKWEGLKLKGYLCPAGVPTAGWGHTGPDVEVGKTYSKAQAATWFEEDLAIAQRKLHSVVKAAALDALTSHQYGALVSFVFNLGAKRDWTIWKHVNSGRLDLVPGQLMRFVNSGGKRLPGLVKRRAEEAALWEVAEEPDEVPPSTTLRLTGMTPPTPEKHNNAPISAAALSVVAGVPVAAKQVQEAVEPYAGQSDIVAQGLAGVATLAAGAAIVVLALTWWQRRQARK